MQNDYTQPDAPCDGSNWFTRAITTRRACVILLVGLALTLLIIPADFSVMRTLGPFGGLGRRLGGDVLRELEFLQQFGAFSSVVIIIVAMVLVRRERRRDALRVGVAMLANAFVMHALKVLISRPRPRVLLGGQALDGHDSPWTFPFAWNDYPLPRMGTDGKAHHMLAHSYELSKGISSDLWSMPSSHAGAAACLAVCLARLYPRLTALVVALALIVGLARVLLGAHFPSDVVAGWTVGYLVGSMMMGWKQGRPLGG